MSISIATLGEPIRRMGRSSPRMSAYRRLWPRSLGAPLTAAVAAAAAISVVRPDGPQPMLMTFLVYVATGVVVGRGSRWEECCP